MPEITVQFKNAFNGYNKQDVDKFLKEEIEVRLQQKSAEIAGLQKQVAELEAKLRKLTGGDASVEQKVELYEKLMKKMDGDYENLLAPAIAKAKAIEAKAEREYKIRIDQAKYTADGIYAETAERIGAVLGENMDRIYALIDDYIRSKTLRARIARLLKACGTATKKVAAVIVAGQESAEQMAKNAEAKAEKLIAKADQLRADAARIRLEAEKKRAERAEKKKQKTGSAFRLAKRER